MLTMYCENGNRKIVDLCGDGDSSKTALRDDRDANTIDLCNESDDDSNKMALSDDSSTSVIDLCNDSDDDDSSKATSHNNSSTDTIDVYSDSDDDDSKTTLHDRGNAITIDLCCKRIDHPLNSKKSISLPSDKGIMAEAISETSGSKTGSPSDSSLAENGGGGSSTDRSWTSSDSGVVEMLNDTNSSKTLSHADSDSGVSRTLSETDCSWTGCQSESHSSDPGLSAPLLTSAGKTDIYNASDSLGAETLNETDHRTVSHGDSLAQAVSEPNRTLAHSGNDHSKSDINSLANMQVDEENLDGMEMTESQLLDMVDGMFDEGFISRLEQEAKQRNDHDNQLYSQAASSTSSGDPFYLPADQLVAYTSVNMNGPVLASDYTTDKEDIELQLLMPGDEPGDSLEQIIASLDADPQFAGINVNSVLDAEYSMTPEISHAAPSTQPGVDYDNSPEVFTKKGLTRSLSSSSSSSSSSSPLWTFDIIDEELENARQEERLQVCEENQAVLPDLTKEDRREYSQQEDCDKLVWEPHPTMDGTELTDYLEKAKDIKKEHAAVGAVPQSLFTTEDITCALSALRHHDFNMEKSLAFLREQCQWQVSPLLQWSEEERLAFVQGVRRHGKRFDKIQKLVKTRSHKEVVEFYYSWKRSNLDGSYRSKKTLILFANARYISSEDDLEDETSADHSLWKRARRERSISPIRSLISSRHKTPPAVPEPEDRSSPTVTYLSPSVASTFLVVATASPTVTTTLPAVTAASPTVTTASPTVISTSPTITSAIFQAREQHGSSNFNALDNECDTKCSGDLDSSSDDRDLSYRARLNGFDQLHCPHSSGNLTVSGVGDLQDSDQCDLNSSGTRDITGMDETGARGHCPNSPRSLGTPERYPKSIQICSDSSSDSSDTSSQSSRSDASSVCSRHSRKRRWNRDDKEMLEFGDVLARHMKHINRHGLGASSRGAARSDVYNSESESLDSDTNEEPPSSSHHSSS